MSAHDPHRLSDAVVLQEAGLLILATEPAGVPPKKADRTKARSNPR